MRDISKGNHVSNRNALFRINAAARTFILVAMIALPCLFLNACSGSEKSPEDKLNAVLHESAPQDIFNVLADYPALEACFTKSGLSRSVFEDKLFRGLLANTQNADVLADTLDCLTPLFEPRTVAQSVFSEDIETEMNTRGPLPDLFSALAGLPGAIVDLTPDDRDGVYAWLDLPDDSGNESTSTYVRKILHDVFAHYATCDAGAINDAMDITTKELLAKQHPQDRTLDFSDIDAELLEIATLAPDGLADVLHAMRDITSRPDIKDGLQALIQGISRLLQQAELYPETRAFQAGLDENYTKAGLGELLERMWTRGPIPGDDVVTMDIEKYGRDGSYWGSLREILMQPEVINEFFEELYRMDQEGFHFDRFDDAMREYIVRDSFLQHRDGEGEFGGGQFYTPSETVSYKNFTALNGWLVNCYRMGIPLSLDAPFMFENSTGGEATKRLIRTLIPTADNIPIPQTVWSDVYEKGEGHAYGHGKPVTTLKGYGMMIDGVMVAPNAPDLASGSSWCLSQIGDGCLNGPYDNIYDNQRWVMYERNYYMVMDMVQFAQRMPLLRDAFGAYFQANDITTAPLVIQHFVGLNSVLYTDMNTLVDNMMTQIGLSSLPSALKNLLAYVVGLAVGTPGNDTRKVYIFPQDIRDAWTIAVSFGFWAPEAFHLERFLDQDNPATYSIYYDVSEYTYARNPDKLNHILPFVAAFTISSFKQYRTVVDQYPASLEYMEVRRQAAQAAFGGLEQPIQYCCNMLNAMVESPLTQDAYVKQPTFLKLLAPLMDNDSTGCWDAIWKIVLTLGKPELKDTRMRLFNGIADLLYTTDEGLSNAPYALAGMMLNRAQKAGTDARYWDTMHFSFNSRAELFSDKYTLKDNIFALISNEDSEDLSAERKAALSRGMATVIGNLAEERFFSRTLIDLSDTVKHLNSKHNWKDQAVLLQYLLADEEVADYVISGIHKAPDNTWDEVLRDLDGFLHSELVMDIRKGSFWDAIKKLVKFIADAFD